MQNGQLSFVKVQPANSNSDIFEFIESFFEV